MRTDHKTPRPAPTPVAAPPASPPRLTAALQAGVVVVVIALALLLAWHPLEDLDIWFHLRAGADQLAQGPLPTTNTYSFTEPGHPWLNHEWLFQLLVRATAPQGAPDAMDARGWNLLRTVLVAAIVLALALGDGARDRLRGRGSPLGAVAAGLAVCAALALLWPRLLLRPELLSYLALVLLVRGVEAWRRAIAAAGVRAMGLRAVLDPRQAAGRVFWLVVAWSQFHGFSSVAPLLVGLGLADPLGSAGPAGGAPAPRWRAVAVGLVASLVALVATPNGWQGLAFPLRAIGQFRGDGAGLQDAIAELTPLLRSPGMLSSTITAYLASLALGLVLVATGWRRLGLLRICLWAGLAWAAFAGQRALGPYAIALALLALRWSPPPAWRSLRAHAAVPALVAGAALAALALGWGAAIRSDAFYLSEGVARRHGSGLATAQYPLAAATRLAAEPPARVFANLGASALLLGTTRSEVFIDGRTEAYSAALWGEYAAIRRGGDQALALLDSRRVDAVCLAGPGGPFARLLADLVASPRWQVASAEGAGVLLRREHLAFGPDSAPRQRATKQEMLRRGAREQERAAAGLTPARAADTLVAAAALHPLAGDADDARNALERAVARSPRHATARHNLGNRYLAEGRHADALAEFAAAAAANRRLAPARLNAGVCLMQLGRPADAARRFAEAARLDPRAVEPWANLAVARRAAGDGKGALAAVERALALSPGDARLSALRAELGGATGRSRQ